MKRFLIALIALAVSVLPTFAADVSAPDLKMDQKPMMHRHPGMKQEMMHQHPGMMKEMMSNPQHLLALGYHKNLVTFGQILKKVAKQGETVPPDFARAAVTEMRRSAAQMEIYRDEALKGMPAELKAKQGDMAKKMNAHLAEMKIHLGHLDDLSKNDRIDSREVLKHLELLFKGCEGMCRQGMCREAMGGRGMGGRGMDCNCNHCKGMPGRRMHHAGKGNWQEMAQQREKMVAEMKAQDAELGKLVDKMNQAPKDKKLGLMADILTRMVNQRAALNAHMEKMQQHMKQQMEGESMGSAPMMEGMDGDDADDEDDYDVDSDDSDSDTDDMNMDEMHMQDTGK